jgi:hypothetical protein
MFSHITQNWRGRPLASHETIVQRIANTTTKAGLAIHAELNSEHYHTRTLVSDEQLEKLKLRRSDFHGELSYTLMPSLK